MPSVSVDQRESLAAAIDQIERQFNVKVLFCSESGSRSWGFDNAESDFDAHFVYDRPLGSDPSLKDTLGPPNEIPIGSLGPGLDLSGWELKKAIEHAEKSNPILWDWLDSPLVHVDKGWRETMVKAFEPYRSERAMAVVHHSIALKNLKEMAKSDLARSKRYFHIARPILCCQWMRQRPGSLPPADFETLLQALPLPEKASLELFALLERKRQAPFEERSARLFDLEEWAQSELRLIDKWIPTLARHRPDAAPLAAFYQQTRERLWARPLKRGL